MEREVHYCTSADGTRIAYWVEGDGPPFVWAPTWVESYSLVHLAPSIERIWQGFRSGRRVVRFDHRGTGLSQRDVNDLSYDALFTDLESVIEAAGLSKFSLGASLSSGPYSIRYAADNPERLQRLVLFNTYARATEAYSREVLTALANLARGNWDAATRLVVNLGDQRADEQFEKEISAWFNNSTIGETAARLIEGTIDVDVVDLLERVKTPVLVVNFLPNAGLQRTQTLAAGIARAKFVTLPGSTNGWAGIGPMHDLVNAFLNEDPETRAVTTVSLARAYDSSFRTVLFTDLVGHTEMMSRLGDERGRAVLREHERITREVLKANGGTEVKTMGDGFMASFGSVTKAVECAIALQRAFAERNSSARPAALEGLSVRVGLNAGEPIEEDGDLFGATVILASRIAARAEGGEILVADTVRGLCSGKGFLFADRGEFVAKGFEEPVRVYEVRWQASD